MSGGQDKIEVKKEGDIEYAEKTESNGHIDLDERVQADLKNMIQAMHIARVRPEEWQERIDLLIRTTVYTHGKKDNYVPNKDFTQLIKANS